MANPQADARTYARIRYRLLLAELALSLLFLIVLQGSGGSHAMARWWSRRVTGPPLTLLGYLAVFGMGSFLVLLPLRWYGTFVLEHRFGLSRMTVRAWAIREAKQLAVSAILGAVLIEGLYALLRHTPRQWPIWATVGWVGVSVVLIRIFPTALLPLFYRTRPITDEPLVLRLTELCRRVGLPVLGVFRFDLGAETRKANAALAGVGKTRRVLLSDTLLAAFTPDEIEGVLAHELGHHRHRHIGTLLLLSALGTGVAFALTDLMARHWVAALRLTGLADIAGFPTLMLWLSLLGLLGLPIQNGFSRWCEWQADRFALRTAGCPQAFADALRRLAQLNLADPDPPRWIEWLFFDHPRISERIRVAEARAVSRPASSSA